MDRYEVFGMDLRGDLFCQLRRGENRGEGLESEVCGQEESEGSGGEGVILSVGGGVSPGMPRENIVAMLEALEEFNTGRMAQARGSVHG